MDFKTVMVAMYIALAYTAWPNLGKIFNLQTGPVCFVVLLVAIVVVTIISYKDMGVLLRIPPRVVFWIIVVSIANAVAIYAQVKFASNPAVQMGVFFIMIYVFQVVSAPIFDWAISGKVITIRQTCGIVLSIPTLWLIASK